LHLARNDCCADRHSQDHEVNRVPYELIRTGWCPDHRILFSDQTESHDSIFSRGPSQLHPD
jgi:hypothetical protein